MAGVMSSSVELAVIGLLAAGFGVFVVLRRDDLSSRILASWGQESDSRYARPFTVWTTVVGCICIVFGLVWGAVVVVQALK